MNDMLLWVASTILIVLGLAGAILPVLPGAVLVLAGIVLGAWIDGFTRIGVPVVVAVAVLAVLSWVVDYLAGAMGAQRVGASRQAVTGAVLGTVAGVFMGLVGVLFMPFVGAVAGELLARRDQAQALRVGLATWLGTLLGMVAKVALAFMMLGLYIVALLF